MAAENIDPIAKRASEFQEWFDGFTIVVREGQASGVFPVSSQNTGNFSFPTNAAVQVNSLYWKWMDELVKPMVMATNGDPETNIDRHKICSLTE